MSPTMQADLFSRHVSALGERMRGTAGQADVDHLRRISMIGRACGMLGFVTAPLMLNPVSVALLATGLMARFVVGHAVGHGAYDRIPGVPAHYTRRHFAQGWRRLLDWPDWWTPADWAYTHNRLHHRHAQAPGDTDVMDPTFLERRPMALRVLGLVLLAMSWKFVYYAPRLRKDRQAGHGGHGVSARDLVDVTDATAAALWLRGYLPYIGVRFLLPVLVAAPFGAAATMLTSLILAELLHNVHAFLCIRPSHCGGDIPLFTASSHGRTDFHLQCVLGTTNYRPGGDVHDLLHGWQNYQVEHHLWPAATLLQYRTVHAELVGLCHANGVPYTEEAVHARALKMARLFLGLDRQSTVDTRRLAHGGAASA